MSETKEKTTLITSVGADAEQPSVNIFMNSIDDGASKIMKTGQMPERWTQKRQMKRRHAARKKSATRRKA